jgi:hypothetical protein
MSWIKGVAHWVDGDVAMISIAFTWRMPEARRIAEYYLARGLRVRFGGPAIFTQGKHVADLGEVGGTYADAITRHNPLATRASRGCPRGCSFCIVSQMDGASFTLLPDFPVRPVLCDDNLSELPIDYQQHIVNRYVETGVPLLDANSGFEPSYFDDETFARWKPVLRGPWRFGFDESSEGDAVRRALWILRDVPARRKQIYVMIGLEPFERCMERIRRVIKWGGEPYVQPFILLNALDKKPSVRHDWSEQKLRHVQRWVNRRIWRVAPFDRYDASAKTRTLNPVPMFE